MWIEKGKLEKTKRVSLTEPARMNINDAIQLESHH